MAYTFTTFDAPSAGTGEGQGTYPLCMNDVDSCAGIYLDSSFFQHGFIRLSDGTLTQFDVPGATETFVAGINNSNTVCGFYYTGGNFHNSHGFFRASDGTITTFDVPTGVELNMGIFYEEEAGFSVQLYSVGNCINNNGDITGVWRDSGGTWHGFIRHADASFTTFDLSGDYSTGIAISGINNNGDVCGNYLTKPSTVFYYKSFFRTSAGTITEYASPSAGTNLNNGTLGYIINDTQDIGGYYADSSGLFHGFIRNSDGTFTEYDVTGTANSTLGTCINSSKQMTGWYTNPSSPNQTDGFVRNSDGTFITFDVPNLPSDVILNYPYAINTSGCVAGSFTDDSVDDIVHGFIGCSGGSLLPLTITANNQTKVFGTTFTFTGTEFTQVGLQMGDSISNVDFACAGAPSGAAVGSYPIVPSNATGVGLDKYTITYVNGTMVVTDSSCFLTSFPLTRFLNPDGTPVSNGSVSIRISLDCSCPCSDYQITSSHVIFPLDVNGNLISNPQVRPNNQLKPDGSYYIVQVYSSTGQQVYGPKKVIV